MSYFVLMILNRLVLRLTLYFTVTLTQGALPGGGGSTGPGGMPVKLLVLALCPEGFVQPTTVTPEASFY